MYDSDHKKTGPCAPFTQIDAATFLEVPIVIFLLRLCLFTVDQFTGWVGLALTAAYLLATSTGRGVLLTVTALAAAVGAVWWLAGIFPENCACGYFRLAIRQFLG